MLILILPCSAFRVHTYILTLLPYGDYSKILDMGCGGGRLRIIEADVSKLPFEDEAYDLITAFETVYFWPGPLESFKEIYRTLSKGGRFVIVNGTASNNSRDAKWLDVIDGMAIYEEDDFRKYLTEAGFKDIDVTFNRFGWFCLSATK